VLKFERFGCSQYTTYWRCDVLKDDLIEHILERPLAGCNLTEACLLCVLVRPTETQDAFYQIIRYLGNRGYNCFLDYGQLLLKLTRFLITSDLVKYSSELHKRLHQLYYYLMLDDRHDLYQNLPYELEKVEVTDETQYWYQLSRILVACLNEDGTFDRTTPVRW